MKQFIALLLTSVLAAACSRQTAEVQQFPLSEGTTWVYSFAAYEPSDSDPAQAVRAAYQLTETVVEAWDVSPYSVAHVKRKYELVSADPGWVGDQVAGQPGEIWYVVSGPQVFESRQPVDPANVKTDSLSLAYDFPLAVEKSWCVMRFDLKNPKPVANCPVVGRREVTGWGPYQVPSGKLGDCYDMIDYYNGGDVFQKFCSGVGIVSMKFDHAGTRFGFEETLIQYAVGKP